MTTYRKFSDAKPGAPAKAAAPPPAQFKLLEPRKDGVDNYHFNHFIHFFDGNVAGDLANMAKTLTAWMRRGFAANFSVRNIAIVAPGSGAQEFFDGDPTMGFRIGGNRGQAVHNFMGILHPDWVAMRTYPTNMANGFVSLESFAGSTLARLWDTEGEKLTRKIFPDVAKLLTKLIDGNPTFAPSASDNSATAMIKQLAKTGARLARDPDSIDELITLNHRHFLAGVRSWRIGYNVEAGRLFVETATIERYSNLVYTIDRDLPFVLKLFAHDIRQDIVDLWSMHMENVVGMLKYTRNIPDFSYKPYEALSQGIAAKYHAVGEKLLGEGYKTKGMVYYQTAEVAPGQFYTWLGDKQYQWIVDVIGRHAGLALLLPGILKK